MQHSKRDNTWSKWGIFLGVAVALGALVVVGWTFMQNRFQPGSSLDANVTIGIDDMPQSLDIRSDSSAAAERLLVDNVYETLVTVDQDNKLQPGLATSWKTSDDGLTVTLTLQSGVTFSNGHTLDASDAVWSLQQNVTNIPLRIGWMENLRRTFLQEYRCSEVCQSVEVACQLRCTW